MIKPCKAAPLEPGMKDKNLEIDVIRGGAFLKKWSASLVLDAQISRRFSMQTQQINSLVSDMRVNIKERRRR